MPNAKGQLTWQDIPSGFNWGLTTQANTAVADPTKGTYARMPDGTYQYFEPGQNPKAYLGDSIPGGGQWAVPGTEQANHLERLMRTGTNQAAIKIAALVAGGAALGNSLPSFSGATTGTGYGSISASNAAYGSLPSIGAEGVGATGAVGTAAAGGGAGAGMGLGISDWLNIGTSVLGAAGAKSAANTEANAANSAVAEQRRQYDQTRSDLMPWLTAGQGALSQLQDPNANFQASPDYGFVRSEGQRDLGNSFAARGGAFSGNALRALDQYNTNLASGEFGNWWNRQAGLAGVGQTAGNALGQLGANAATNIGNGIQNAGNARASGVQNSAAILSGGAQNILSNYLYRQRYPSNPSSGFSPYVGYGG